MATDHTRVLVSASSGDVAPGTPVLVHSRATLGRMAGRSLPPDENERLQKALQERRAAGETQEQIATRVGVSQQTISRALKGDGAGFDLARRFAAAYGLQLDALLSGRPTTTRVVYDSRYPNLDAAIQFAGASSSPVSAEAVENVRSFALKSAEDLPAEKWLEELRFAERLIRDRAGPQLPGREMPAPVGRAPLAERVAKAKAKK
jgi:transcriptional regulator with XRE-family HTH domain